MTREFYYNDAGAADREPRASRCSARAQELAGERRRFRRTATTASTSARSRSDYLAARRRPTTASRTASRRLDASASSRWRTCATSRTCDLQAFGVKFDVYYLESSLYTDGRVERDGAAPARARQDVRARRRAVAAHHRLRRRQGPRDAQVRRQRTRTSCPTSPITSPSGSAASRKVINVQGADHHGTVARVRAGLQALEHGHPAGLSRLRAAQDGAR